MIVLWILLAVVAVLFLVCLVIALRCLKMVTKPFRYTMDGMREQEIKNGYQRGVEAYEKWERHAFLLPCNGVTLAGEYIPNPADRGPKRRVVIVCHGHTANRYAALKYGEIFYRAGFSLVIYDQRYFGESTGDFCTLGQEETKDLLRVIAYTRTVFGPDCLIGLQGESMGAATVLLCLAHEKPDFVVADCPFANSLLLFEHILRDNMRIPPYPILWFVDPLGALLYNYLPGDVNPVNAVASSDVPICLMHGHADKLIPCSHSEMLRKASKNPHSELHLFEGADHACSFHVDQAAYEQIMMRFVEKVAPAPGGAAQNK